MNVGERLASPEDPEYPENKDCEDAMFVDNILPLVGRTKPLFDADIASREAEIRDIIHNGRFLVIGGAGTIGSAICRELFARDPRVLHVVDISENNMVELVRDIRSSAGYGTGEFATFALDCGRPVRP